MKYLAILLLIFSSCEPAPQENHSAPTTQKADNNPNTPVFPDYQQTLSELKGELPNLDSLFGYYQDLYKWPGVTWGLVYRDSLVATGALGVLDIKMNIPASAEAYYRIASMSKSFTAMALLKLRDEGKVSLDDPAEKYIDELAGLTYPTTDAPRITLRHLLTMTAGFPEDNPWGDRQLDVTGEAFSAFLKEGISFSTVPGNGYEYSNLGYALIGEVITRVAGEPYQTYISRSIFQPLGMNNTHWEYDKIDSAQRATGYRWEDGQWKEEPLLHDGVYGAMGGIITTMQDFAKYVSFHLSAWPERSDEERGPLKRSSVREMHQMTMPRIMEYPETAVVGYGFGLRITKYADGSWSAGHGGALPGFGSNYFFYPELGLGFIGFCNLTYTPPTPALMALKNHILESEVLKKYQLPVSNILSERKEQVIELLTDWESFEEAEWIAMNFYMDKDLAHRKAEAEQKLAAIGKIVAVEELRPLNDLRGRFMLVGENGRLDVFFTLTPEKMPKMQRLDLIVL